MREEMKTPETLPAWLVDVQDAYDEALRFFDSDAAAHLDLTELYKLAAPIAAARRGISDQDTIDSMTQHTFERVDSDIELGGSLSAYKFHFVYSYIHSHTSPEVIDEFGADDVMGYVNDHWDLFDEQDV